MAQRRVSCVTCNLVGSKQKCGQTRNIYMATSLIPIMQDMGNLQEMAMSKGSVELESSLWIVICDFNTHSCNEYNSGKGEV